ncbi:MAG: VCBS repeat-containing protein [Planctomycetota bacterium]
MRILVAPALVLLAVPVPGQRLLHTHTLPLNWNIQKMRSAGDANGDGHPDVAAFVLDYSVPGTPIPYLMAISGLTGMPLYSVPDMALQSFNDVLGFGDVNNDGRSDIAIVLSTGLRVYSGANGSLLYASAPPASQGYMSGAAIGDYNVDGRADLAIASYDNGNTTVRVVRGENGAQLANLGATPNNNSEVTIRSMGDLNGDGKQEVAIAIPNGAASVLHGTSGAVLWAVSPPVPGTGRTIETLDLDGDGKRELFFLRPQIGPTLGLLTVHDPVTGAQLFAVTGSQTWGIGLTVAGLGDLEQDGRADFALSFLPNSTRALSGASGRRLWSLPGWQPGYPLRQYVVGVGDVDADGFGDFVQDAGDSYLGSVHLISGKILADSQPQAGACGAGPFFPQLGATRPILGQTVTIAGQDGPPATPGILAFSLQPATPVWLGASSCYAYFDLGGAIALAALSQPQWSLSVPLPLVPQLAGFEIALQSWYAPTAGPLGYDLSNGVWARLGYQ